ncbi:metallophosphoesterase family protein [Sediminibacterium soli]|uniref:metallophosphoesterase family protein n=1 Tax=Sediminibacterium soli TaxID=2698829 RepID=UPI0013794FE6|nr:metallophosphoesterase [Sediminibacterium soli]NCI46163.1 metallophosphoesterase [Sediminibacterium soli]
MSEKPVSRRNFIRNISLATAVLLNGKTVLLSAAELSRLQNRVHIRFVAASDMHYGQPDTSFGETTESMIRKINRFHASYPLDFTVLNGDLIHNEKSFMPLVKAQADKLSMPYYVTRGNHDMVTAEEWLQVWKYGLNHDVVIKDSALLLCDTSNEKGVYLSPDLVWLEEKLDRHAKQKQVFLFVHIPQAKWTANAIDTPAFFTLLKRYPNVRAVFHGHEHDQDGVKMENQLPFFFDSHVGGNWGTPYKGFRVVELLNNGTLVTYMMDPDVKRGEQVYERA